MTVRNRFAQFYSESTLLAPFIKPERSFDFMRSFKERQKRKNYVWNILILLKNAGWSGSYRIDNPLHNII